MAFLFLPILEKEALYASLTNGIASVGVREGGSIYILNFCSKNTKLFYNSHFALLNRQPVKGMYHMAPQCILACHLLKREAGIFIVIHQVIRRGSYYGTSLIVILWWAMGMGYIDVGYNMCYSIHVIMSFFVATP